MKHYLYKTQLGVIVGNEVNVLLHLQQVYCCTTFILQTRGNSPFLILFLIQGFLPNIVDALRPEQIQTVVVHIFAASKSHTEAWLTSKLQAHLMSTEERQLTGTYSQLLPPV
jgi:hypothetical protein